MEGIRSHGKVSARGFELVLRPADERDKSFCYELMSHNMRVLFDRNTEEKWSRSKFKSGFNPDRITVIEHDGMSIGFYDLEKVGNKLYWHNMQLSEDYRRGIGVSLVKLIELAATNNKVGAIFGKVFSENERIIGWLKRLGYEVIEEIEQEKSYWVRKDLGGTE